MYLARERGEVGAEDDAELFGIEAFAERRRAGDVSLEHRHDGALDRSGSASAWLRTHAGGLPHGCHCKNARKAGRLRASSGSLHQLITRLQLRKRTAASGRANYGATGTGFGASTASVFSMTSLPSTGCTLTVSPEWNLP